MPVRDQIVAATALLLMSAPAALAQTPEAPVAAKPVITTGAAAKPGSQEPALDKKDRIVCRSVRYTGTRFPERTCKTVREMELQRDANQRNADTMKRRGQLSNGRGYVRFPESPAGVR